MISDVGKYGELKVAIYLRNRKWTILGANYTCRFGEIDLIACKDGYVAFIEVKTRDINAYGLPREFVDMEKQRKIIKTAQLFLMNNEFNLQPRFDVAEVHMKEKSLIKINYIENAFEWRENI